MTTQSNAADIAALTVAVANIENDSENFWLIGAGILVLALQLGFMCLEIGTVRTRDTKHILVKNVMNLCVAAIFYWGFGYAFAFGESILQKSKKNAGFIGDTLYFYSGNPTELQSNFRGYAHMFFNFALSTVSASIVSGAIAERGNTTTYFFMTALLTGLVYPVASHWMWATVGWLCPWQSFKGYQDLYNNVGAIDFAGSAVIHLVGGTAAFFGAWWMGPRKGRFDAQGNVQPMPKHSTSMQVMGTFILWAGWYGITVGSMFTYGYTGYSLAAGRIAMTTTLAAAAGAITNVFFHYFRKGEYCLTELNNGVLSGLVAISAGCATVAPWAAIVIGILAAFVYNLASWFTLFLRIDDVLDSVAIHGWCGIFGMIACAFLSRREEMLEIYGTNKVGVFYGQGQILAANVVSICVVLSWTSIWMFVFFGICHYAGVLRISEKEEQASMNTANGTYDFGELEIPSAASAPNSSSVEKA